LAAGLVALAAGCAQPPVDGSTAAPPDADWITLTTAEEFGAKVVDRTLTYSNGLQIVSKADGTYDGNRDVSGRWEWIDGTLCRELRISGRDFPYECQRIQVNADGTRFRALNPDGSPRAVAAIG
jgi:hypothetical protein